MRLVRQWMTTPPVGYLLLSLSPNDPLFIIATSWRRERILFLPLQLHLPNRRLKRETRINRLFLLLLLDCDTELRYWAHKRATDLCDFCEWAAAAEAQTCRLNCLSRAPVTLVAVVVVIRDNSTTEEGMSLQFFCCVPSYCFFSFQTRQTLSLSYIQSLIVRSTSTEHSTTTTW